MLGFLVSFGLTRLVSYAKKKEGEMAIKKCSSKKVIFKISAPTAKDVRLAGDFNSWDASRANLKKSKDGVWTRDLTLKSGRYEYKYLIDGQWQRDPLNNLFIVNAFGSENSVIEL